MLRDKLQGDVARITDVNVPKQQLLLQPKYNFKDMKTRSSGFQYG